MSYHDSGSMEIVIKGDQTVALKEILRDRLFALGKMPSEKIGRQYDVFGHPVLPYVHVCAIRNIGDKTQYNHCEYYLCLNYARKTVPESSSEFEEKIESVRKRGAAVDYMTIEQLLEFLLDKELVFASGFMFFRENQEVKKRELLEDKILLLRDERYSDHILYDNYYDVKIFLTKVDDGSDSSKDLHTEKALDFDVVPRLTKLLREEFEGWYDYERFGKEDPNYHLRYEDDFCAEFEARSEEIQASYFLTRFHSNPYWSFDPVCMLCYRFAIFILPGSVSKEDYEKLSDDKRTIKYEDGSAYRIDSILQNGDILSDISVFEDLFVSLVNEISMA